jgi:hypothetical protein
MIDEGVFRLCNVRLTTGVAKFSSRSARTAQKTRPFWFRRGMFTAPLYKKGRGPDRLENTCCYGRYLATAAVHRSIA